MSISEGSKIETRASTRVSTKGQVILPKAIRDLKSWAPGTELTVELTEEGVLLRDTPVIPRTRPGDVFGVLKYDGPPKTIEDMDKGIMEEVLRRYERGRY